MNAITRTNQRDQVTYLLQTRDGTPCCPHCDALMTEMGDTFENSHCCCWWHGAANADYTLQVVVAATEEHQAAYLARKTAQAAAYHAEAKAQAERFQAAKDLVTELGGAVRISAKKSKGRGGHAWADLPITLKDDPRLALIPLGHGSNFFQGINFIAAANASA